MPANNVPKVDSFLELSLSAEDALNDAIPELAWIRAGGGNPSPSLADRVIAEDKESGYKDQRSLIRERLLSYLSKKLSINPPSTDDLNKAKQIATDLADFKNQNIKVTSIIHAVTDLLNIYAKT